MFRRFTFFYSSVIAVISSFVFLPVSADCIHGVVRDANSGEEIIGATISLKGKSQYRTVSGLDGTFSLESRDSMAVLVCSCMGYRSCEVSVRSSEVAEILLENNEVTLSEVCVVAGNPGVTESGARLLEHKAMNVLNVMSSKAMELSPDVTVANVIQRMSGVTVERNSSGEGQYAILRGMDKRYNYTLVNGVKISSPDNKNRFVPLDMFPGEMLDRLEVSKSLTADMEGDGIGGAVNLVMKDAPLRRQLQANISTGYNAMYFNRDFTSFDWRAARSKSPYEVQGRPESYRVTSADFTTDNLHVKNSTALPDLNAGLSYGDRFFGKKLGLMTAFCYQHTNRGKEAEVYYMPGKTIEGTQYRTYSTAQTRLAAHAKLDYALAPTHKLTWYGGYMDMREQQVREMHDDLSGSTRLRQTHQYIFSTTLQGEHRFRETAWEMDWRGAFSKAFSETPDQAEFNMVGSHIANTGSATRRWEHNDDRDWSGYLDLRYNSGPLTYSLGGMFRDKKRTSFFNEYTFDSSTGTAAPQYKGEDWQNYDELLLTPRPYGNIGDPLNYDATEQVGAAYLMAKADLRRWNVTLGLRAEHTRQGYTLIFPRDTDPEGLQRYTDLLPSAHLKYEVHDKAKLHLSYCRSINRPSFFEIVPYTIINEDYKEKGNPDLQHTVADNLDLRYEFFPKGSEQLMVGLFYKHLHNPIEYGLINEGQDTYYKPLNLGNASNAGVEVDIMKYFKCIGIKANYTYTYSRITTDKRTMQGSEVVTCRQSRPLFGQAAHVANVSLLYKSKRWHWEGQLAYSFTGKRLSDISNWLDDDIWEKGFHRLDLSIEKSFERTHITVFGKASNLLDTPVVRIVGKSDHTANVDTARDSDGYLIERREWHGQSFTIGLRWKL